MIGVASTGTIWTKEGDFVLELVEAGGWLMLPIIACSIVALAIIVERI
jgi:biopolymer transport protein ExbB/TolQ